MRMQVHRVRVQVEAEDGRVVLMAVDPAQVPLHAVADVLEQAAKILRGERVEVGDLTFDGTIERVVVADLPRLEPN
jgi:hypothetical protein